MITDIKMLFEKIVMLYILVLYNSNSILVYYLELYIIKACSVLGNQVLFNTLLNKKAVLHGALRILAVSLLISPSVMCAVIVVFLNHVEETKGQ